MNIQEEIAKQIQENPIILYMKGDKHFPQCGFSGRVVQILNTFNVNYVTVNVLADANLREGIKVFSDWPTIPQLYINGEFIGGCDIVSDLYEKGQLEAMLQRRVD